VTLAPTTVKKGQSTVVTMTVTGSGATPTGSVTLTRVAGTKTTAVFVRTLSGGKATISYPQKATGTFVYRADYAGDSTYAAGKSSTVTLKINP
jgi:hypothetical protein